MEVVYFMTIVDIKTMSNTNIKVAQSDIDARVEKHLGGWGNLKGSSWSDSKIDEFNYQQSGTTKDGKYMFSILRCINTLA